MSFKIGAVGTMVLVPRGEEFLAEGWLPCDGRCYMGADFPELFKIFHYNKAPGDPVDSFRVPNQQPLISSKSIVQLVIKASP